MAGLTSDDRLFSALQPSLRHYGHVRRLLVVLLYPIPFAFVLFHTTIVKSTVSLWPLQELHRVFVGVMDE